MSLVKFNIDDELQEKVMILAKENGFKTVHSYCKFLLSIITNANDTNKTNDKSEIIVSDDFTNEQITIFLSKSNIKKLDDNAKLHGLSRSKEAAMRIKSTLNNELTLYFEELKGLNDLRVDNNRIGRNINQIIKDKQINIDSLKNDINQLQIQLKNIDSLIKSVIKKARNRY